MSSKLRTELSALCEQKLPKVVGMTLRVATISDHVDALYPTEREAISKAVSKRVCEFSTGRWLARELMATLGIEPAEIGRGDKREPVWPEGVLGSITHADDLVVASVARSDACRSVGLDLECWSRVTPQLHDKLFSPAEISLLDQLPAQAAGLLFSAKEAGYKATYPLAGRFIGFHEAEIDVNWAAGQFAIRYIGAHDKNRVMEEGQGYFLTSGPYVLSWFIVN